MKHTPISRREFLKNIGMTGAGVLLAASPWLSAFSEAVNTSNEKCRLGIIGPGSRGRFLMSFLVQNPKVDIVALCDIYQPSIDEALKLAPKAKVYGDYRELLENNNMPANMYSVKKRLVLRWKSVSVCTINIVAREKYSSQVNSVCSILVISKLWK